MSDETYARAIELTALPHAARHALTLNGRPVLLCNWKDQLFAVANVCSHADQPLDGGRLGNGWIACPLHGARFDLATGKAKNPPATRPIATYPVRVVEGWIEVAVP